MATNNLQFQQRTEATTQILQTQIGQSASVINQNQPQVPNSLPSQAIPNPNANGKNVSVITLRSGKQIVGPALEEPNSEGVGAEHKEKALDTTSKMAIEPSILVPFP